MNNEQKTQLLQTNAIIVHFEFRFQLLMSSYRRLETSWRSGDLAVSKDQYNMEP